MRPHRFYMVAGLLYGLAFAFATPPFQAPDEPSHFFRAYALSEGTLWAQSSGGELGAVLPASLGKLAAHLKGDLPGNPGRKIAPEKISRAFRTPLDPKQRRFTDFRTAALVSPLSYVPQAAAIAIARSLGAPALVLLYAARLANVLLGVALIAAALRQVPSYRWLMALLALTPMAAFVYGSASADTFNLAAAFVLAATAARLSWGEAAPGRWRDFAVMTLCSIALCLAKPVYVAVCLLPFLIPASRFPGGRRAPALLLHALLTGLAFWAAMAIAGTVDVSIRPDAPVDFDRQIRDAVSDPLRVAGIFARDYWVHGGRYAAQIVGQLGWLDTNLPKPLLWAYLVLLGCLALVDTRREVAVLRWQRALLGAIALATMALVSATQYALWTPYGANWVEGIQGRYFLPLAPAAAWILHTRSFAARPALLDRLLPWLSLLAFAVTFWTLLRRYYGIY